MFIHSFKLGSLHANCYVVSLQGRAAVIDPGGDPTPVLDYIDHFGFQVENVLLTHMHHDHMGGVAALVEATGAPVIAGTGDKFLLEANVAAGQSGFTFVPATPGMLKVIGQPCMVLETPGHTPGSVSYFFPEAGVVFTGDLVFHNGIGRTDLPYGDAEALFHSIYKRIFILPDDTEIHSGHGPETTVGKEKERITFAGKDAG